MKEKDILKAYEYARERYAALGVDTDKAVAELEKQQKPKRKTALDSVRKIKK